MYSAPPPARTHAPTPIMSVRHCHDRRRANTTAPRSTNVAGTVMKDETRIRSVGGFPEITPCDTIPLDRGVAKLSPATRAHMASVYTVYTDRNRSLRMARVDPSESTPTIAAERKTYVWRRGPLTNPAYTTSSTAVASAASPSPTPHIS